MTGVLTSDREYRRWQEVYADDLQYLFSCVQRKYPTVGYTNFCLYVYFSTVPIFNSRIGKRTRPLKDK